MTHDGRRRIKQRGEYVEAFTPFIGHRRKRDIHRIAFFSRPCKPVPFRCHVLGTDGVGGNADATTFCRLGYFGAYGGVIVQHHIAMIFAVKGGDVGYC